uniref:Uncharacterized protein n=1 Tax=Saimiri boliviensis boliviensis TaxID=39432 RepID=A0A2K6UJ41_SAIBB
GGTLDSWDADAFSVEDPGRKSSGGGTAGDAEEGDLRDNRDDDDDDEKKEKAEVKPEVKISEKKKKIKKRLEEPEVTKVLTPEKQSADKPQLKKLEEGSGLELAKETSGVNNTVYGTGAMNPFSRDDFTEFGKLLKDKITQYEKSLYYAICLEVSVHDVYIALETDDLKKITNSLAVSKKSKQSKARKKKGVIPGGGLKATMEDDPADYGGYDRGYVQDYEDFMRHFIFSWCHLYIAHNPLNR